MKTQGGYREIDGKRVWTTTVTVVSQERYDQGPFDFGAEYNDGSLYRVIESLNAIRASIPEEYRDNARCEIDSSDGYGGSHYARITVSYVRPETAEEAAARGASECAAKANLENAERAQFEALKKKFG